MLRLRQTPGGFRGLQEAQFLWEASGVSFGGNGVRTWLDPPCASHCSGRAAVVYARFLLCRDSFLRSSIRCSLYTKNGKGVDSALVPLSVPSARTDAASRLRGQEMEREEEEAGQPKDCPTPLFKLHLWSLGAAPEEEH